MAKTKVYSVSILTTSARWSAVWVGIGWYQGILRPRRKKWKNMQGRPGGYILVSSGPGQCSKPQRCEGTARKASRSNQDDHVLGSVSWPWSRWSSQRGVWPNRCINPSLGTWLGVLPSTFEALYASLSCSLVVLRVVFDCLSGLKADYVAVKDPSQ